MSAVYRHGFNELFPYFGTQLFKLFVISFLTSCGDLIFRKQFILTHNLFPIRLINICKELFISLCKLVSKFFKLFCITVKAMKCVNSFFGKFINKLTALFNSEK